MLDPKLLRTDPEAVARNLARRGFEWVVSTATTELRHLFTRMGLEPVVLGVADPGVLGEGAAQWGSYYTHQPLVVAGSIEAGMARIGAAKTRAARIC